jgi:membrane dipeptidase
VTDLHVDLGWAIYAHHASLLDTSRQASLQALAAGQVGTLVLPLYVDKAYARPAREVRKAYEATLAAATLAFTVEAKGLVLLPFGEPRLDAGAPQRTLQAAPPGDAIRVRVSFEGADGFADAPEEASTWISQGACLWGLVHSRNNALGGASQDPSLRSGEPGPGLTATGRALAMRILRGGGVLDVAHASDATARDLAELAEAQGAPIVASHTGMRALYNIPRNLPDALIRRIARSGGVVGVSFYRGHLTERPAAWLTDVVRHIEHLRTVGGTSVLAIGSDFEGGIVPPRDAPNASAFIALAKELQSRGFRDDELSALFHGNADRVFAWAEAHGCGAQATSSTR